MAKPDSWRRNKIGERWRNIWHSFCKMTACDADSDSAGRQRVLRLFDLETQTRVLEKMYSEVIARRAPVEIQRVDLNGGSGIMPRVLIIQAQMKHYRIPSIHPSVRDFAAGWHRTKGGLQRAARVCTA